MAAIDPRTLERSYWVHASLATVPQRGYWGTTFPFCDPPAEAEVGSAARLLAGRYGADRLYLVYHHEMPIADAERVFRWWATHGRAAGLAEVVPTLVLRMYDTAKTAVFTEGETDRLAEFFRRDLGAKRAAVYDVYPDRDQGPGLARLAARRRFPGGLVRVGIQPEEALRAPFAAAVQDTWSAFCHGKTDADWTAPGFGRETLRRWIDLRNRPAAAKGGAPVAAAPAVAWDLIVVAWDYAATARGEFPGYDDADRNMPLPPGRNRLALREIARRADPARLAGFSSDLYILQANSISAKRDGQQGAGKSFYETLKRGEPYTGYFAAPLREIAALYAGLKRGRLP